MTSVFINKSGNQELILFFNGWGMDHHRFETWTCGAFDLLVVHDYTHMEALPDLSAYSKVHLVAWSLGVWAAAKVLEASPLRARITSSVAINGTLTPIHPQEGIAPEIFAGTIGNWADDRAREKFGVRVSGTTESFSRRSTESQVAELIALQKMLSTTPQPANIFQQALIGTRDRIFPPSALRAFWSRYPEVRVVEKPVLHDPFVSLRSWEEVLALAQA
jgi:pimeloyl-[acyl-carrier protein] methyl ester esterase